MIIHKGDFIEIDFSGKIKDGEVFDSTLKDELEKIHHGHDHKIEAKPFVFCLGKGMFLKSLEDFLDGKETEKWYEVEISPADAFGYRIPTLVQKIPIKIFIEQKINPFPGAVFNFDGQVGKVLSVSSGRVVVDFNHILAGKTLLYKIKILRKVDDINEKVKALNEFFFKKDLKFEIKDKKIIIEAEKSLIKTIEIFKNKFKEILNLDLEIKEIKSN
ncbi:MAG: peptidylprolyl isomerase [Candidatus Pacearchaeota archaeon]